MQVLVAVDDTDNLETKGTGHLAEAIARDVERNGWGTRSFITRHQLLVHPDVPYTSHNSAMCFAADVGEEHLEALTAHAAAFLAAESAPGSDLRAHPHVDSVRTLAGRVLGDDERVLLSDWKVKPVLRGGRGVLLVVEAASARARWETCPKALLKDS